MAKHSSITQHNGILCTGIYPSEASYTYLIKSLKSRKNNINSKGSEDKLFKFSSMDSAILEPGVLIIIAGSAVFILCMLACSSHLLKQESAVASIDRTMDAGTDNP